MFLVPWLVQPERVDQNMLSSVTLPVAASSQLGDGKKHYKTMPFRVHEKALSVTENNTFNILATKWTRTTDRQIQKKNRIKTARTKQPSQNMGFAYQGYINVFLMVWRRGSECESPSGKVPVTAKNDESVYWLCGGWGFVPHRYNLVPMVPFEVTDLFYQVTLLVHCSHVLPGKAAKWCGPSEEGRYCTSILN